MGTKYTRHTMQGRIDWKDEQLEEKDKQILEAKRQTLDAINQLRRQQDNFGRLLARLPMDVRVRIAEEQQKMADKASVKKDRGISR